MDGNRVVFNFFSLFFDGVYAMVNERRARRNFNKCLTMWISRSSEFRSNIVLDWGQKALEKKRTIVSVDCGRGIEDGRF